jgi:hypothetical protein
MPNLFRSLKLAIYVMFAALCVPTTVLAEQWPVGMSLVGLKAGSWQVFVVPEESHELTPVPTELEARTKGFDLASEKLAYIGADGSLREQHIAEDTGRVLLKASAEGAYTQPTYSAGGDQLYVVLLKQGASVDTDILTLSAASRSPASLVIQRSAQFEPVVHGNMLFYSNVLCTVGCGKIIQEIWRMNLGSGEAEQITLQNSIARQPAVSADGQWLYFSSNRDGYFHIWRINLSDGKYERLTGGVVTDVSPAVDDAGNLYFIRRSPEDVQLMKRNASGALQSLALPAGVVDLRDLEISRK